MTGFFEMTLLLTVPLLLAASGELLLEKSGTLNIGIEGTMLVGAFAAFAGIRWGLGPESAFFLALSSGGFSGAIFSLLTVIFRADPVLTGTAWNLLAAGATAFGYELLAGTTGAVLELPALPVAAFGLPWPGIASYGLPLVLFVFFSMTRPGLLVSACGETPEGVRSLGWSVVSIRSMAAVFAGMTAAAGGAILALSISHTFVEGLTAGRGFLALSIVVFTRWKPLYLLPASLLTGGATAFQYRLQASGVSMIPYAFFLALPALLSLVALSLSASRTGAPRALGTPAP